MLYTIKNILAFLLLSIVFWNCKGDLEAPTTDPAIQLEKDIKLIDDYLTANGLTAQETNTGLHYIIEEKGSGDFIEEFSEVNVLLKGYYLDGEVFDETRECYPVTLNLSQVIPGFQEGLQLFNTGGKGSLFLPSALGFGQTGNGVIPVNTVIAFDIEIVEQKFFDQDKILNYIAENNLTADSTLSGIYYIIEEPGEGEHPTTSSTVTVNYKGFLVDGTVFDQREFQTFQLTRVIQGWQEAIPLLKPGGKGTFLIPSKLGYGTGGNTGIPGNAVLIFEVELLDFN